MRIGIDARSILNPEKNPAIGVGHYTFQLIKNLLDLDNKNKYILFFDYRVREKDVKKFSKPNVEIKYFPWSDYKKYLPGAYSEILGLATMAGKNLDVLHATSPEARVPFGYRGKVITTFQNLAIYKQPELYPKIRKARERYSFQQMAKKSDKIIAVSENTKKDLMEVFKIPPEKISVIYNGIDKRFFEEAKEEICDVKKFLEHQFKISEDYILFIGTLEPVKNLTRLIQAFAKVKEMVKGRDDLKNIQLVLAGKPGWLSGEYLQIAKDLGVADDVKFPGYIEGDDLKKLFKGAKFFIMPSLYEGFGMTVLEAMACKKNCLVSDIPTLKEIAGTGVRYFNPMDVEEMALKMKEMLETKEAGDLIETAYKRAHCFSWQECAQHTLKLYEGFRKQN